MTTLTRANIQAIREAAVTGGHFTIEHPLIGKIPLAIIETKIQIALCDMADKWLACDEAMQGVAKRQVQMEVDGTIALVEDKS